MNKEIDKLNNLGRNEHIQTQSQSFHLNSSNNTGKVGELTCSS